MTIGDKIKIKVKTYTQIYDDYINRAGFNAEGLALHDLYLEQYITEKSIKKIKDYIKKQK